MSCKIPLNNGINIKCATEPQWLTKTNSLDTTIKLAGEEAKDRLYEPKHKKKLVRVLTVIAYVFFVSLAAIMLSLYYVFLWNGNQKLPNKYPIQQQQTQIKCDGVVIAEKQLQTINQIQEELEEEEDERVPESSPSLLTTTEDNITWTDYDSSLETDNKFNKPNYFLQRLMYSKYPYAEND